MKPAIPNTGPVPTPTVPSSEPVTLWAAGAQRVAALRGRTLVWYASIDAGNRWGMQVELPAQLRPEDVAALHPSDLGTVALVTRAGDLWVADLSARRCWTAHGNVLNPVGARRTT